MYLQSGKNIKKKKIKRVTTSTFVSSYFTKYKESIRCTFSTNA